jgi:hypothetical protein
MTDDLTHLEDLKIYTVKVFDQVRLESPLFTSKRL